VTPSKNRPEHRPSALSIKKIERQAKTEEKFKKAGTFL
jgi:hypothetical protein